MTMQSAHEINVMDLEGSENIERSDDASALAQHYCSLSPDSWDKDELTKAIKEHQQGLGFKAVDTFNGGEHGYYDSEAAAEAFLALDREEFYKVSTSNTGFCRAVVPASSKWEWDQYQNKFCWSE